MDSTTLAIAVKKAREEAEKVARSIVPERGPKGDKGDPGRDGKDGRDGRDGIDGRDGADGRNGRDGKDGEAGQSSNRWYLFYSKEYPGLRGYPPDEMGNDDDFAINGDDSRIYHKEHGEWVFILSLQGGGGMQMMAPAVVSEGRIETIIRDILLAESTPTAYKDTNYSASIEDEIIIAGASITVTLPNPVGNKGKYYEVKRLTTAGDVTVKSSAATATDFEYRYDCMILTVDEYSLRVISDGGTWLVVS